MPRSKSNATNPVANPLDTFLRHVAEVFGQHLSEVIGRVQAAPRAVSPSPKAAATASRKRVSPFAGSKLDMACRVAGCPNRSGGPRWGFMCKKHRKLSKEDQQAARDAWKGLTHGTPTAAVATEPVTRRRRKGAKRSASTIASTTAALLAHIKANKGERIEQIAKALKVSTTDLKLPAAKLVAEKQVKTTGAKRGTKYFAA